MSASMSTSSSGMSAPYFVLFLLHLHYFIVFFFFFLLLHLVVLSLSLSSAPRDFEVEVFFWESDNILVDLSKKR